MGSIPGWGTKITRDARPGQKQKSNLGREECSGGLDLAHRQELAVKVLGIL